MSDPRDYFDDRDEGELIELIALLATWWANAERAGQYAVACCLHDWLEDMQSRLTWLQAYKAYGQGRVS